MPINKGIVILLVPTVPDLVRDFFFFFLGGGH
jgi:hypothetical protein